VTVDSITGVQIAAADGWPVGGLLQRPASAASDVPGAVLVPASRHERDAYTVIAAALADRGIASLRIDVRGRGTSRGTTPYARMAPRQRERVTLDVAAAFEHVASAGGIDAHRLAIGAEQDTAVGALSAVCGDARLRAVVVLSPRHGERCAAAVDRRRVPVFGLVSKEDREGLRATVDTYLAGAPDASRLEVFDGLGFGTTMLSTRQFEHPDDEPLEAMIADWLASRLV
jgi:dienelactone hydrolase